MKLEDRIQNERIASLEQLAPAERELVQADAGLTALLEDNAALTCVREEFAPAPPWENLRATVIAEYDTPKEQPMSLITRLMSGRPWYAKAALGMLIVAVLLAVSLILPRDGSISPLTAAWAASDGYILNYVLPAPTGNCQDDPLLDSVNTTVRAWADEFKAANEGTGLPEPKIMLRIEIEKESEADAGSLTLSVMAVNLSYADMESLRAELTEVAGLPEPAIEESTWFHDKELQDPDCVSVTLNNRTFNFPPGASEEEMEALLTEWLLTEHEGFTGKVDIEIGELNGEKHIKIMIMREESK